MSAVHPTGTGGFVYRAERHTSPGGAGATTSARVGPGSYEVVDIRHTPTAPSSAPFHTSAERAGDTSTSAMTPGPGAYELVPAAAALLDGRSLARGSNGVGFASNTARMHTDKSHDGMPGPGRYTAGPTWGRKSHRYSAPASRQRLSFQRVPSAPSIPANHQSYGYEEAPDSGVLVMQKQQEPIHSGVGLDRVGPGAYDPSDAQLAPRAGEKAPTWSHSRTLRGARHTLDTPGPGAYHVNATGKSTSGVTVSINGVEVVFGGAGGSSSFASRAQLHHQRVPQDHERTPGPGAYLQLPVKQRSAQPHFFGSTGQRGFEVDPVRSHASPSYFQTPGPGAYNDPRRSVSAGPKVGAFLQTNAFSISTQRFGKDDNGIPGPGQYRLDETLSVMHDISQRAAVGRSGVFGSTSTRFHQAAGTAGSPTAGGAAVVAVLGCAGGGSSGGPGPGSYSPPLMSGRKTVTAESANFASQTDRFAAPAAPSKPDAAPHGEGDQSVVRGDPSARGPGAYDLLDPWKRKTISYKSAAFGSDAKRSGAIADKGTASTTPGPGRYRSDVDLNAVFRPLVNAAPEMAFGAASWRFKEQPRYAPGPGQYEAGEGFQKRSYNVTYHS